MIYTVTLNPSLDYIVAVDHFTAGKTNRTTQEALFPGGKGINVSIMLTHLGIETTALGFLGGFTGNEIERRVRDEGCRCDFVRLNQGLSRINVKMSQIEGTEINGRGPDIGPDEINTFMDRLDSLQSGDILVLAGSIPASLSEYTYVQMIERVSGRGISTVVDASGSLLKNVLPYRPFLIKPNLDELGDLFGVTVQTKKDAAVYGEKLLDLGACNVIVSMAGEGAVFLCEDGRVFEADAPRQKVVSGVGAGDSLVAGFLAGWTSTGNYEVALRRGIAAGSASAFCEFLAEKAAVDALENQVEIIRVS